MEFSGYYSLVRDFLDLSEEAWLEKLTEGCTNIGRNLNDTRGLFHSFRDCRTQMLALFRDLADMAGDRIFDWEIVFELRLKRSRYVRIYDMVLSGNVMYKKSLASAIDGQSKARAELAEALPDEAWPFE